MNKRIITIDCGNTNISMGIHLKNESQIIKFDPGLITNADFVLFSKVGNQSLDIPLNSINLNNYKHHHSFFDMPFCYTNSIGIDRLIYAYHFFKNPHESYCLIDAGTFITVDFVDGNGFLGGYIFPGLSLLKSTIQKSDTLNGYSPEVTYDQNQKLPPKSTPEALSAGLRHLISSIEHLCKNQSVIITGGDAVTVANIFSMKTTIQPNILHQSMKEIALCNFS